MTKYPAYYPDVAVCMLAYNLEDFVSDAIEGVLSQNYEGKVTIVIGEDCSQDSTLDICKKYQDTNPGRIEIIEQRPNCGISENLRITLNACDAKYVAICEGDDYWTDPNKLTSQVEFLEANKEYSMVFQNFDYVFEDGSPPKKAFEKPSQDYVFEDFLERRVIVATQTMLFRRESVPFLEVGTKVFDWLLLLSTSYHGKVRYFDEIMTCYRQHATNWTRKYDLPKAEFALELTKQCRERFPTKYRRRFTEWVAHCHADICFTAFEVGNRERFDSAWKECIAHWEYFSGTQKRALLLTKWAIRIPAIGYFLRRKRAYST